ncbi:MAG: dihydrodipicolinate reductase [Deltaproteobacteria bacterium]|nr:dihydrodipicolinate reductase [Deltaproteobacteria bacterium]
MEQKKIRVIHYGLGPIGLAAAKLVLKKTDMEIVGAVDISKEMVGRDLGEILGAKPLGVHVTDDAARLFAKTPADVVIHTAGSRMNRIAGQIEEIIRGGKNIVSSGEELLFPTPENVEAAKKIDKLAREKGVTVLGTGVNPGFVMDALPLTLTGVCEEVREVHVERVVDAGTRRYPLQRKVGAGMAPELFRQKVAEKAMGHVGLRESLLLIADRLNLAFDEIREAVEPVIAEKVLKTDYFELKPGDVAGIQNIGEGFRGGKKIVSLDLKMYIGAESPHDSIRIVGTPALNVRIEGGVAGDQATAAILVNSIPAVIAAAPGLVTVKDLPSPWCRQA